MTDPLKAAAKLREDGNALYKSGQLIEAIKAYRDASKLAPTDVRPLSNLSAAYFELGDYGGSTTWAQQAIDILSKESRTDQIEHRIGSLKFRMDRCAMHQDYQQVPPTVMAKLLRLPRCRPSMTVTSEYFSFGHDELISLWDDSINKHHKPDDPISFFFAGIGDARHLFATLLGIQNFESQHKDAPKRKFHFTINDVKAPAVARDLVIFALLQDLAEAEDLDSSHATLILGTLHYVYSGAVMPSVAHEQLQVVIQRVLKSLESAQQPLPWVYTLTDDIPSITRCLRYWQKEVMSLYSTSEMIDFVVGFMKTGIQEDVPADMQMENTVYANSGVMLPPKQFVDVHEPGFKKIMVEGSVKPKALGKKIAKLARETWRINPTMVDYEWVKNYKEILDVGHNPLGSIGRIFESKLVKEPKNPRSLYDYMSTFFIAVAKAMKGLGDRFIVETVLGDCAKVLEEIRVGVIDHKDSNANDSTAFPTKYDRIHMSNIPDYVGGHLTTFTYALPMLKPILSSHVTANCLKNSGTWPNLESFNAEYLLIPDDETLSKLLQARIIDRGPVFHPFPLAEYTKYGNMSFRPWPFHKLVRRSVYNRWIQAIFLKTALPWHREMMHKNAIVVSPLNLTILFRVFVRMRDIGYPAHWISDSIYEFLSGEGITTTVRPPRRLPLRIEDVHREYPNKKLIIEPFVAEFGCLAAIFQPLLRMELVHMYIPESPSIFHYTFELKDSQLWLRPDYANLVLVFWDHNAFIKASGGEPPHDLRPLLDPSWGEVDPKMGAPKVQHFREKGVAVWSTFEFDVERKVARLVMDEEFVEMCKREKWWMGLWRTDMWCRAFDLPIEVRFAVQKGERWMDDDR